MKNYKYIARDQSGVRKDGIKQASSSNDVVSWLREQQLTPVSVNEISAVRKQKTKTKGNPYRKKIKSSELAALCWQLTTMVEGGISITNAIETVAGDIENLYFQKVLRTILDKMRKGEPFSKCIAEFPKVFNRLSCAIILAGETGGNLAEALRRLAEYFDTRDKLARKVKGAMAYPIFVFFFIIVIVVVIMTFIIPRFQIIFDQFKGELPAFTQAFMGFYNLLRFNLHYIIGLVILLVCAMVLAYTKSRKTHYAFSKIFLSIPLIGRILSQAFVTIFCRTMATLLSSGVSVLETFDILSTMTNNDIIKAAIVKAKEDIVEGVGISSSLAKTDFFPNMVVKMTEVGEESGSLSKVLERTANYYERRVDSTISTVMALLEPVMIITVGAIVLVTVLALYLPVFQMSEV